MKVSVEIWDWPLRLFHWLLVIAVTGAYITGELGGELTDWHGRLGTLTLGLLVFRLVWGFSGPTHARFVNFLPSLSALESYSKGEWQGLGHNPFGALAVIALLAVLAILVTTGLFANDDIAFEGPLFNWVDKDFSDKLSGWHDWSVKPLLILLALHLSAIGFYLLVKKINLVKPMLIGKQEIPKALEAESITAFSLLHLLIGLLTAIIVVWLIWR